MRRTRKGRNTFPYADVQNIHRRQQLAADFRTSSGAGVDGHRYLVTVPAADQGQPMLLAGVGLAQRSEEILDGAHRRAGEFDDDIARGRGFGISGPQRGNSWR
jgi:hypothetical protein